MCATSAFFRPWNWCVTGTKSPALPQVGKFLRENGLFTFLFGCFLFVVPPLCITEAQIDEGLEIIERALQIADDLYVEDAGHHSRSA